MPPVARIDAAYIPQTFGALLRHLRLRASLSQRDLAIAVGYSESQISRLEQQQRQPDPDLVRAVFITALDLDDAPELAAQLVALAEASREIKRHEDPPHATLDQGLMPAAATGLIFPLPVPLTPLINRTRELAVVCATLLRPEVRLLTLVGPPGIGKTRLSLQVAEDVRAHFADGATFVPLAPVRDSAQVNAAIARALGSVESNEAALQAALRDRAMVLVLDNFEQIIDAAPRIALLLRMAPRVKVLVTSRAPLQISGEYQYAVPPLELPNLRALPPFEALCSYPAIQLFAERMRAMHPDFALTEQNAPAVVELCARLDGLPLAIELAVARSQLLTPQALLARLRRTSALTLLVHGPRDLLAHQQTLRSTLEWSYQLLDLAEQVVLMHLGVFVGGCTAEALAAVCNDALPMVEEMLGLLVNQSLLTFVADTKGNTRFVLLETIREYALEKLCDSHGFAAAVQRHAAYYAALAAEAASYLTGAEQDEWLDLLQTEEPNIEAALGWFAAHDVAGGLRCATDLHQFWIARGFINEGRSWLARLLAQAASSTQPTVRSHAWALHVAGALAYELGEYHEAESLASTSLAQHRALQDEHGSVAALMTLGRVAFGRGQYEQATHIFHEGLTLYTHIENLFGMAQMLKNLALIAKDQGDLQRAIALHDQALALYHRLGHRRGIAQTLVNLSIVAYWQGEYARAGTLAAQGLAIHRELGDRIGTAYALDMSGMVAYKQGYLERARHELAEGLRLFRSLNEQLGVALILHEIGLVARAQGSDHEAVQFHHEALAVAWRVGDQRRVAFCLEGLADVYGSTNALFAARLFAAAEALRVTLGTPVPPGESATLAASIAAAQLRVDATAWSAAWVAAQANPLTHLVDELLLMGTT